MKPAYNQKMFKEVRKVPSFVPERCKGMLSKSNVRMFICPDAVELVAQMKKYEGFRNENRNSSMTTSRDESEWNGTKSFPEAVRIMQHGSDQLKKIVAESNRIIKHKLKDDEFEQDYYRFDTQGLFFDVGEVLSGAPEAFLNSEKSYKNEKHTDIIISNVHSASVDQEVIMKNAATVIALVKMLEQRSVRTRITVVSEKRVKGVDIYVFLPLKGYNEPFNYNKLSAYVHISLARRIMFKWQEVTNIIESGYAYPLKNFGGDAIDMSEPQNLDKLIKKYYK